MKRILTSILFIASVYGSLAQCNGSNKPEPPVITFETNGVQVTSVCNRSYYEVRATSPTEGVKINWTKGSILTGMANEAFFYGSFPPGATSHMYSAKAVLNGCESDDASAIILIEESPSVTLSTTAIGDLCESDDFRRNPVFIADASNYDEGEGFQWYWIDEAGIATQFATESSKFDKIPTIGRNYVDVQVRVSGKAACNGYSSSSDVIRVNVVETPIAQAHYFTDTLTIGQEDVEFISPSAIFLDVKTVDTTVDRVFYCITDPDGQRNCSIRSEMKDNFDAVFVPQSTGVYDIETKAYKKGTWEIKKVYNQRFSVRGTLPIIDSVKTNSFVCEEDSSYTLVAQDINTSNRLLDLNGENVTVKWYNSLGDMVGEGIAFKAKDAGEYKAVIVNRNVDGTTECSSDEGLIQYPHGKTVKLEVYSDEDCLNRGKDSLVINVYANRGRAVIGEEITLSATVANAVGDVSYEWYSTVTNQRVGKSSIGSGAEITFVQEVIADYYVVATDLETGTSSRSKNVFDGEVANSLGRSLGAVFIYPTLVEDLFYIEGVLAQSVEVLSQDGSLVKSFVGQSSYDVSGLASGVYTVKVVTANGVGVNKIIIQK